MRKVSTPRPVSIHICLIILLLFLSGCKGTITITINTPVPGGNSGNPPPLGAGTQIKTANCQVNGPYPDKACTPGEVFAKVTAVMVCTPGYSSSVRNVTT